MDERGGIPAHRDRDTPFRIITCQRGSISQFGFAIGVNVMLLVGEYCEESPSVSQRIAGYFSIGVFLALMAPWVLIGVGLVVAGCLAASRGETGLFICIPAGIALLVGIPLISYLHLRWNPPVVWFEFDGNVLKYAFQTGGDYQTRSVSEIVSVCWVKRVKSRRIWGYNVTFRDRKTIYVPQWLTNADALSTELSARIADK